MSGYKALYIKGNATGLVQNRQEFILPDDAYPTLENAFIFREQIRRKQAFELLGRLRRVFTNAALGNTDGAGAFSGNLKTIFSLEAGSDIQVGSLVVKDGTNIFTDNGLGVLVGVPGGTGTINYSSGAITITGGAAAQPLTISFAYYPNLPVMGIRTREKTNANDMTVFFDTTYAYNFAASGFVEFITGTTWTGTDYNFFWTTNYWIDSTASNKKIFWATNYSGPTGDPIRYTNGTGSNIGTWEAFNPTIDAAGNQLTQCLALLPYRGRLVAFNTYEGSSLATSTQYSNRIRWAAIGTPFTTMTAMIPATNINVNAWRDDIRGQGGYLNIPTNEDIVSVGFVRDNIVIYCENSTWQLRYTGRTIAPFQIEKVNTELGAFGPFSGVQFDTSLVGIGDKGVVECDSFKSDRIDIKIPNLVMEHFSQLNNGPLRVHGARDFLQRIAYWIYPESDNNGIYPDHRLVYNYENDSWAIFTDSLTALGNFQPVSNRTWANPTGGLPSTKLRWEEANFSWVTKPLSILQVVGGNQQGFIEYLDQQTTNDQSLTITAITGNTTTPTVITSPNHNLQTGAVLSVSDIPAGTPFATSLNYPKVFGIVVVNVNQFALNVYDPTTGQFSTPQLDAPATYIGGGQISVRDNFSITSKKFNFLEQNQNIQLGYIDILLDSEDAPQGAITLNVYENYNDNTSTNAGTDSFFNTVIPIYPSSIQQGNATKTMQRVFCPSRANFITLEYTFSNAQMNGVEQEQNVQIDAQTLWVRPAGRIGYL